MTKAGTQDITSITRRDLLTSAMLAGSALAIVGGAGEEMPERGIAPTPVERLFAEWRAAQARMAADPNINDRARFADLGEEAWQAEIRFRDCPALTVDDLALKLWALIEQDYGYDPDGEPPEDWQKDAPGSMVLAIYRDARRLGGLIA